MDIFGKSQEGEEEEFTITEDLVNYNRKVKMGLLNLCVIFTCNFLFCDSYASMF